MRYIVPIGEVEHLFDETELGLVRATELAKTSRSKVILEGEIWKGKPRKKLEKVRRVVFDS